MTDETELPQVPIPAPGHEDTESALAYFEENGLAPFSDYLQHMVAEVENGKLGGEETDRYLNVAPEGDEMNIATLIDLAWYYGRVYERTKVYDDG